MSVLLPYRLVLALILAALLAHASTGCDDVDEVPAWAAALPGDVVFVHRADGGVPTIYMIGADGTGLRPLYVASDPQRPGVRFPTWRQDGARIAFTAMHDGAWRGFEMDAEGRRVSMTSDEGMRLLSKPSLAPDLVVEQGAIVALSPGGERHTIARCGDAECSAAAWGPDKDWVIYQQCDGVEGCMVRVARADGGGDFVLTNGRHPNWRW